MKKLVFLLAIIAMGSSFQKKKPVQSVPKCILEKIEAYKKKEKHDQPQNVIEYEYKGKKVYYVTMPCCDFFNELYDAKGNLMGHPDGGFTGRGDGKLPDFTELKKKERIIWQATK